MRILLVDETDPVKMAELTAFAESFEHKMEPSPWPLYEVLNGEKRIGYFRVCKATLFYPSIHPHSSPREVKDSCEMILNRLQLTPGQVGTLTPPKTKFTERIMKKLGFQSTNLLLHTVSHD